MYQLVGICERLGIGCIDSKKVVTIAYMTLHVPSIVCHVINFKLACSHMVSVVMYLLG